MGALERPLVWVGQRGEDSESIAWAGRLGGIICCDWSPHLAALASVGTPIESVERDSGIREGWSSASLSAIEATALASVLDRACKDVGAPLTLVPYRALWTVEHALGAWAGPPVTLAAPAAARVDDLDDKITQRRLLNAWGVPTPVWMILPSAAVAWPNERESAVRFPAVIQRRRGSLGRQTLWIGTPAELADLPPDWLGDDELLISEFHEGPVINITGVVAGTDIHLAWPSVQLVGLAACGGEGTFLYCGNDFAASGLLSREVRAEVLAISRRIAAGLGSLSFRGLFGLDFLWNGRQVMALEINPRFQGSTAWLTALELQAGVLPTVARHFEAFLPSGSLRGESSCAPERPARPLAGAEVVLYHQIPGIARAPMSEIQNVAATVGLPVPGIRLRPGASLGRLRFPGLVLRGDLVRLRPEIEETVAQVRRSLVTA